MKFKGLTLDPFQEQAINAIEANKSVMVSAPTGSGKTLIADYIVHRDLSKQKRVVYTAPIKALSNQKYFDFCSDYGSDNVGLLTGDTVINPTAPVLIMTTEVYRNMVVVNDPIIQDISYVIFDEIHYISDIERGYVWEESIIFSPEHIRFLCLSATVPNADEFASWIGSIKSHEIVVVKHRKRPVPLEKLFFDRDIGIATLKQIKELQEQDKIPEFSSFYKKPKKRRIKPPHHADLIALLKERNLLPCIFFTFSRMDCQRKAEELGKSQTFLNGSEIQEASAFITKYFRSLDPQLQNLSSTKLLRRTLTKGIGFHHAGLLPALKHLSEQLFAKKLVKVLYATETFAVGINMPAKTVCFNALRKFDGREFRYLNSKEYFQLAGRAGRRGIDSKGRAIAMINRQFDDVKKIKRFTSSDSAPIKSQFKISYNTVLNLVSRHSNKEIARILKTNFHTYQQGKPESIQRRFENRLKTLTKMGYVSNGNLTEKGNFVRNIFVDELIVGEMFGTNFYEGLTEYQFLLIFAALVFEPRAGVQLAPPVKTSLAKSLLKKIRENSYLRRIVKLKNITTISALVHPLYHGQSFTQLLRHCNLLEGDLLRFLRQIIDRVSQVRKATTDPALARMMENTAEVIDRALEGIEVV